ncbi:MAG: hypothetical protein AAGG68_22850 [Bacteroidota bacterium]
MKRVKFSTCTLSFMEDVFGLEPNLRLDTLDDWLKVVAPVTEMEQYQLQQLQKSLSINIFHWNEQELSLNFIGPIFSAVQFTTKKSNFFAQRHINGVIDNTELFGKTDGLIASGFRSPKKPYFSFHEFKKEMDSSGDPAGQNLAAMLVGQVLNEQKNPIYGCFVNGQNWYFMVLEGKQYAISNPYFAATEQGVLDIFRVLKGLKKMIAELIQKGDEV